LGKDKTFFELYIMSKISQFCLKDNPRPESLLPEFNDQLV